MMASEPITLTDEYGPVNLYLLPFLKPAHVRRCFPEREILTYTDALAAAIEAMGVDPAQRNVLVTHQFVTGAAGATRRKSRWVAQRMWMCRSLGPSTM